MDSNGIDMRENTRKKFDHPTDYCTFLYLNFYK